MLPWNISDIDWSTADTPGRRMEARVVMDGLKHIPIRNEIQMLSEQSIVCICKDVPWMTGRNLWEEIIRVPNENGWFILW